eukprot:Em0005g691a
MAETDKLIELLQQQMEAQRKQTEALIAAFAGEKAKREPPPFPVPAAVIPSFVPFDATVELWTDYSARFHTFLGANSVPAEKRAQVFLTNHSREIYKLLSNLASQQSPVKGINDLSLDEVEEYMRSQFDPTRYIVRERFKFWTEMNRKPGETIQELAARISHDAVTCDFSEIHDPLDEALRTRFMCSVKNEAVLKALFKIKDGELTFARAITVAMETEEAAKVAKETVYGSIKDNIHVVHSSKSDPSQKSNAGRDFPKGTCPRCGKTDHMTKPLTARVATRCVTTAKRRDISMKGIRAVPQLQQNITMNDKRFVFEVDTGAGDNFCTMAVWKQLGNPTLLPTTGQYEVANGEPLPTLGVCTAAVALQGTNSPSIPLQFTVTKVPHLNLLGRDAIVRLGINVSALMGLTTSSVHPISNVTKPDINLQNACKQLCQEFPDLFKPELGCLKDVQLEVRFKPDSKPVFCKPRVVPLAIQDELGKAYITRGVWQPTQFNDYGTPVVPIRKATLPGQTKSTLRVCGDYSVTVNPQLEEHRYPMPRPEDLMQRLGGGHGFTKIDLADAYNQIQLSPESQKRLALSTHRGVLLQMRLPFGISSAPGYFQELMDKLTCDLQGVAVYMDDILGVSKGKKVDAVKLMPPPENVLMQYRRTPLADGYSPSELLNGRQIRAKIDTLLPSPAHMAQARQAREATKAQAQENPERVTPIYNIGTPCYALYCGPRQEKDPKWVPAVVTKVFGSRSVNVRVIPRGGTWRRHIEQLRLRYGVEEDADPGEVPTQEGQEMLMTNAPSIPEPPSVKPRAVRTNPRWPTGSEYGPGHPRRSTRQKPHH